MLSAATSVTVDQLAQTSPHQVGHGRRMASNLNGQRTWVEKRPALNRLAVGQHETIHARPGQPMPADRAGGPEFDEYQVVGGGPSKHVEMEIGCQLQQPGHLPMPQPQAPPVGQQRLHEPHILVQDRVPGVGRRLAPSVGEALHEPGDVLAGGRHATHDPSSRRPW